MWFRGKITPEIQEISHLQRLVLPDAIPSLLGFRYTCAFYRFALGSPDEVVVTDRSDGKIVALAVATFAPKTLTRRLLLKTPLLLAAVAGLFRFRFWSAIFDLLFGQAPAPLPPDPSGRGEAEAVPELLILCTAPEARRRGRAAWVLQQVEALMRVRGATRYMVRTLDDDNLPAVRFYTAKGFTRYGRQRGTVWTFRLMEKRLVAAAGAEQAPDPAQ